MKDTYLVCIRLSESKAGGLLFSKIESISPKVRPK